MSLSEIQGLRSIPSSPEEFLSCSILWRIHASVSLYRMLNAGVKHGKPPVPGGLKSISEVQTSGSLGWSEDMAIDGSQVK